MLTSFNLASICSQSIISLPFSHYIHLYTLSAKLIDRQVWKRTSSILGAATNSNSPQPFQQFLCYKEKNKEETKLVFQDVRVRRKQLAHSLSVFRDLYTRKVARTEKVMKKLTYNKTALYILYLYYSIFNQIIIITNSIRKWNWNRKNFVSRTLRGITQVFDNVTSRYFANCHRHRNLK